MSKNIQAIPTNVVMGFLGSGKTTRIQTLINHKRSSESWGVLVNEFGEVGIDGKSVRGAVVKEVSGGCMCCTAGLPAQMGLALLIQQARPQRLIIEPTGLGHPTQLLAMLQEEHYRDVIDLQSVICLIDPRRLEDERYTRNSLFRDQARVSDVLLATKTDLCTPEQINTFYEFAASFVPHKDYIGLSCRDDKPDDYLRFSHNSERLAQEPKLHSINSRQTQATSTTHEHSHALSPDEWTRSAGASGGFSSCGWRFGSAFVFAPERFRRLLRSCGALRAKALLRSEGLLLFNYTDNELSVEALPERQKASVADESLVEVVFTGATLTEGSDEPIPDGEASTWEAIEQKLFTCLSRSPQSIHHQGASES